MFEKIFHLKENHTDVKTEVMAGITTFMTMAYILAVNPSILSASGMDANAVLIATSLASFVGTALMALLANYLFDLARAFHSFYEACPVLKSEGTVRHSRLALCELTARTLKHGLGLLGIQLPDRM